MARWVLPLLLLAAAAQLPDTRTVYVTVVTDKGAAVPDLTPADFEVKVEGRVRPVLSATQPVGPLTIAVLLDDKGGDINEIRVGLATLLSRVEGHAEVSLTTVMPSIVKVFDFTSNGAELRAGLRRLVFRPGPSGGLLLQAISEAADDLHKREAARPAIVVLTFEGQEYRSHTPAEAVLASLERSRALMHVVAVGKPEMQRMVSRAVLEQQEAEGVRGDDWAVDQNNRNAVLGDGPKQSGGRRHELAVATGLNAAMAEVADDLLHQYAVVYSTISDGKPSHKLAVSVKRKGITVRAPTKTRD